MNRMWGLTLSAATAGLLGAACLAQAADVPVRKSMPPEVASAPASMPFDLAFGARAMTDYNFRGISQTDHNPAVQAYVELQAFDNFVYAGASASNVDLVTTPSAEVDLTFGIRPKFGPLTFDLGLIYYYYPGERQYLDATGVALSPRQTDFAELAGKVSYNWEDTVVLGANVFHAWDWLGTGADATYYSGTVRVNLAFAPGLYASGELGRYVIGTATDPGPGYNVPDYTYWNVGVGYTYKNVTVDVRYHDTNLNRADCFLVTTDPGGFSNGGRSNWCESAVVGSISVDFTASSLGIFAPR